MPVARAGQIVGLLGGSFDPPHDGHVHITRHALRRFGLHQAWWLISPGNPLKPKGPAPLADRMTAARQLMQHPRVKVTDLERRLDTRYTAHTLKALMARYPGVKFVWLMGADNLTEFHKWDQWQWIMENVSIGVLARPGERTEARHSVAATRFEFARLNGKKSRALAYQKPPCWCFVNVPMVNLSSTAIRARGDWIVSVPGRAESR